MDLSTRATHIELAAGADGHLTVCTRYVPGDWALAQPWRRTGVRQKEPGRTSPSELGRAGAPREIAPLWRSSPRTDVVSHASACTPLREPESLPDARGQTRTRYARRVLQGTFRGPGIPTRNSGHLVQTVRRDLVLSTSGVERGSNCPAEGRGGRQQLRGPGLRLWRSMVHHGDARDTKRREARGARIGPGPARSSQPSKGCY